jgi:hypothetical protein
MCKVCFFFFFEFHLNTPFCYFYFKKQFISCENKFCIENLKSCSNNHKWCKMCVDEVTIHANENGYSKNYISVITFIIIFPETQRSFVI